MTFAKPDVLLSLLLLPPLVLFLVWTNRQRKAALARLGDPALIEKLLGSLHRRGRRWKTALFTGGLALLLVSLARPQWGQQLQAQEGGGVQVMIVLDVSTSMLAQDLQPDRLTRAKAELSDLLAQMEGDEVGLVPFSQAVNVGTSHAA
ncbi:MAG: VWA domain-containing protein, partial [Anaerolineales bacterium]